MIARTTPAGTPDRAQAEPPRVVLALTAAEARLLERSTVLFAAAVGPYVNAADSPLRSARLKLGRAIRLAAAPAADEDGPGAGRAERPRARVTRSRARRPAGAKHL